MPTLRYLSLVVFSPLALAACGGGTVAIELTDAELSLDTVDRVEVTLGKVEVYAEHSCHGGDDDDDSDEARGEWQTVNESAGTFDLLSLRDDVTAPLGEVDVWGEVTRIRMHIDTAGKNQVVLKDGPSCALDVSGVAAGGVEISHDFDAIEPPHGGRATVVVDFDVEESVQQKGACSFALVPVLKVKRVETDEDVAGE